MDLAQKFPNKNNQPKQEMGHIIPRPGGLAHNQESAWSLSPEWVTAMVARERWSIAEAHETRRGRSGVAVNPEKFVPLKSWMMLLIWIN